MSFGIKEKSSKKRIHVIDDTKETSTLDALHSKTIEKYSGIHSNIGFVKNNINKLETNRDFILGKIKEFEDINCEEANILWNSNVLLKEEIRNMKENIKKLETQNEINYYENTGNILFNYYDIIDKQLYSSSKTNKKQQPKNDILSALQIDVKDDKEKTPTVDKSSLVNKYLALTDTKYINHIDEEFIDDMCPNCKIGKISNLQFDAVVICLNCGYQDTLLAEQNRPVIMYNSKDTSHYSYKRINHFKEWISQVQGKESTEIPAEVFEKILSELKKQRVIDFKSISYKTMRSILKNLKLHRYYEHLHYILNRINGEQAPQFSAELEEKLCNMFKDIQGPFLKHCPKNRKNFLSYSYVLYKFCQTLGCVEYLKHFPLLKSRVKIFSMDQIWQNICIECGYKFIPSL
tara:strand:- start:12100 stop:13314 length:1215 start_codon:yes stop_codon:yes gene_type:complete